jgi:hypothetical protein
MLGILHLAYALIRFFPTALTGRDDETAGESAYLVASEALASSAKGFRIAGPLLDMLRSTAAAHGVTLPRDADAAAAAAASPRHPRPTYLLEDYLQACANPTFVQPMAEIQRKYSPSFAADWLVEVARNGFSEQLHRAERDEPLAQDLMHVRNLLN